MGARFLNSLGCLTGSTVWLFSSQTPAVLDYYSNYMAGHMYSFCFLITPIFSRGKLKKHAPLCWGLFGRKSENYSEQEEKNPFTQGAASYELQGGKKIDWAALLSRAINLSSHVSSPCPLL